MSIKHAETPMYLRRFVVVLVTAVSVGAAANTAQASPEPVPESSPVHSSAPTAAPEPQGTSEVLRSIAVQLTKNLPEDERQSIPGYGGLKLQAEHARMDLYWKGPIPAYVERILAELPPGVTVDVHQARYSRAELRRAKERMLSAPGRTHRSFAATGARWTRIGPNADGSGLHVGYAPASESAGSQAMTTSPEGSAESSTSTTETSRSEAARLAAEAPELEEALSEASGVDVSAAYEESTSPTRGRRQNGWAPWDGGMGMLAPGGFYCTSGFGARRLRDNKNILITAQHCGGSGMYRDATGQKIGKVIQSWPRRDAVAINVGSKWASGRIFVGRYRSRVTVPVRGAAPNFVGDVVCTAGANSGDNCDVRITDDEDEKVIGGIERFPLVIARQMRDGRVAAVSGDSGGPVFHLPNGLHSHTARGIMSGASEFAPCPRTWIDPGSINGRRHCYRTIAYVPITAILRDFDLLLVNDL